MGLEHAVGAADISVSGSGDGAIQDGANPTIEATVIDLVNSNPVAVAIVDGSGTQITSFGGGTQYAEDTAAGAADVVTMAGAVRKDTAASLVDTDGDRTELQTDSAGRLRVTAADTTQPISAVALPLPAGAATAARQDTGNASLAAIDADLDVALSTRLAEATFTTRINTQGQKAMAASTPVVLASDQTVIPVSDNGGSLTVDATATATAYPPTYAEAASAAISQDLAGGLRTTRGASEFSDDQTTQDILRDILIELRVLTYMFQHSYNIDDDVDTLRPEYFRGN